MSADVVTPLNQDNLSKLHSATSPTSATSKVDSAIEDGDHVGESYKPRRRTSSTVTGVFSIAELGKVGPQINDAMLTVTQKRKTSTWRSRPRPRSSTGMHQVRYSIDMD